MLSRAPVNPESENTARGRDPLEADKEIASALLTESFLSPQGSEALSVALSTPEPAKAVAVMISQVMEMALTESSTTEIPMSPEVWLMPDGAVDESAQDIQKVAEANGIELPPDFIEEVIDQLAVIVQKRAEEGEAPPGGPAPMPGQPQPAPTMMGGTPNGMG